MRLMTVLVVVGLLTSILLGQEDARHAQVRAAQANAVSLLQEEIRRTLITRNLTVGEFLDRTNANTQLTQVLERSQQIGGPRWIGENTCQVQLAISGARVVQTLTQIAAGSPRSTPLPPEALQRHLAGLEERTFVATGTSTGASVAQAIRPHAQAWASVSDEARKAAVNQAIRSAAQRVGDSVAGVELVDGLTLAQAMQRPSVARRLDEWVGSRPVMKMDFREDLSVVVTLSAPPTEVSQALRETLQQSDDLKPVLASVDWDRIERDVVRRVAPAVGYGRVPDAQPLATRPMVMVQLGDRVPRWVGQQLSAEGTATFQGTRLKTARHAEKEAIKTLRLQVNALPLAPDMTVGDAGRINPDIGQRLELVLALARTEGVEYREDGSVSVRVSLDLREVWEALVASRR